MYRGSDIIKEVTVNKEKIKESINCYDINPNIPFVYPAEKLPVEFEITLKHPVKVKRLYCLPIQNDREFLGVIRDYRLQAEDTTLTGTWKNGFETCWSEELDVITDRLTLTVLSTYSQGEVSRFEERKDGWYRVKRQNPLVVSMAALGVEYEEAEECVSAEAAGAEHHGKHTVCPEAKGQQQRHGQRLYPKAECGCNAKEDIHRNKPPKGTYAKPVEASSLRT